MQKKLNFRNNMGSKKYSLICNKYRLFHGKCAQMSFIASKKKNLYLY